MVERFRWLLDQGLDPITENAMNEIRLDVAALSSNKMILDLFNHV